MPNLTVYVQCKRNAYCYPVIHALHNTTQGRSQEETTTEANTRSVVRNQPYEIF